MTDLWSAIALWSTTARGQLWVRPKTWFVYMIIYNDVTITIKNLLTADFCKQKTRLSPIHPNSLHMWSSAELYSQCQTTFGWWTHNFLCCIKGFPITIPLCFKLAFGCRAVLVLLIINQGQACNMKYSRGTDGNHSVKPAMCTFFYTAVKMLFALWCRFVGDEQQCDHSVWRLIQIYQNPLSLPEAIDRCDDG